MRAKHFETVSQELHHKFHHIFHHRFHHRFHHNFIIARAEFFVSNWDSGRNVIRPSQSMSQGHLNLKLKAVAKLSFNKSLTTAFNIHFYDRV